MFCFVFPKVYVSSVTQLCPTLQDPMDCFLSGFSAYRTFQSGLSFPTLGGLPNSSNPHLLCLHLGSPEVYKYTNLCTRNTCCSCIHSFPRYFLWMLYCVPNIFLGSRTTLKKKKVAVLIQVYLTNIRRLNFLPHCR